MCSWSAKCPRQDAGKRKEARHKRKSGDELAAIGGDQVDELVPIALEIRP
jgi:hypothetical protein